MGPNPRVVKIFIAELGLDVEREEVDLMAGENRQDAYRKLNPAGQLPALQLDSGTVISEVTAICEYLDDVNGGSELIGSDAELRAQTRMWTRRIDLGFCEPMANGFRASEGRQIFENRMKLVSLEASAELKAMAQDKLDWLNEQLAGKQFVCGDRFSLADILLYAFVEFGAAVGQPLTESHGNIKAWFDRVGTRPTIAAAQ